MGPGLGFAKLARVADIVRRMRQSGVWGQASQAERLRAWSYGTANTLIPSHFRVRGGHGAVHSRASSVMQCGAAMRVGDRAQMLYGTCIAFLHEKAQGQCSRWTIGHPTRRKGVCMGQSTRSIGGASKSGNANGSCCAVVNSSPGTCVIHIRASARELGSNESQPCRCFR